MQPQPLAVWREWDLPLLISESMPLHPQYEIIFISMRMIKGRMLKRLIQEKLRPISSENVL